jgi:dipeptidyl aminopeptidase/acylaminoacyl peptidase
VTADIESGQEARLTSPPAGASDCRSAWSHDGKWIAFNRRSTGSATRLYLVPASGGDPRALLLEDTVSRTAAAWSLDDQHLLFVPGGPWGGDISEVEIGTGKIRPLTAGATVSTLVLSSTGRVVFSHWSHDTYFFRMPLAKQVEKHEQISLSGAATSVSVSHQTAGRSCFNRAAPDGRCCGSTTWRQVRSASSPIHRPDGKTERRTGRPMGRMWCFSRIATVLFNCGSPTWTGRATRRLSEQAIPMDGDWWVNARVVPRWWSDGRAIAYLPPGERGSTLWLINPDGRNARPTQVSGVLRFDWYLGQSPSDLHAQRRGWA